MNMSPRGVGDCSENEIQEMRTKINQEHIIDKEGLNLTNDFSNQINYEKLEFSTTKAKKNTINTRNKKIITINT